MKYLKTLLFVAGTAVAAALLVGANGGEGGRPSFVTAENWIAVSDKAGFALTTYKSNSQGAELWLKTEEGWIRGRLENPFVLTPVRR